MKKESQYVFVLKNSKYFIKCSFFFKSIFIFCFIAKKVYLLLIIVEKKKNNKKNILFKIAALLFRLQMGNELALYTVYTIAATQINRVQQNQHFLLLTNAALDNSIVSWPY